MSRTETAVQTVVTQFLSLDALLPQGLLLRWLSCGDHYPHNRVSFAPMLATVVVSRPAARYETAITTQRWGFLPLSDVKTNTKRGFIETFVSCGRPDRRVGFKACRVLRKRSRFRSAATSGWLAAVGPWLDAAGFCAAERRRDHVLPASLPDGAIPANR